MRTFNRILPPTFVTLPVSQAGGSLDSRFFDGLCSMAGIGHVSGEISAARKTESHSAAQPCLTQISLHLLLAAAHTLISLRSAVIEFVQSEWCLRNLISMVPRHVPATRVPVSKPPAPGVGLLQVLTEAATVGARVQGFPVPR